MKALAKRRSMGRGRGCQDGDEDAGGGPSAAAGGDQVKHSRSGRGGERSRVGGPGVVGGKGLVKSVGKNVAKGSGKVRRTDQDGNGSRSGDFESGNDTERGRGDGTLGEVDSRRRTRSRSPPPRARKVHDSPPDPCDARPIDQCRASWGGHQIIRGARLDKDSCGHSSSLELEPAGTPPSSTLHAGALRAGALHAGGAAHEQRPALPEGGEVFRRPREDSQRPLASGDGRSVESRGRRNRSSSSSASESRERAAVAATATSGSAAAEAPSSDLHRWRGSERDDLDQLKRARKDSIGLGEPRVERGPGKSGRAAAQHDSAAVVRGTASSAGKKAQEAQSIRQMAKVARRLGGPSTTAVADRRRPAKDQSLPAATSQQRWTPAQDEPNRAQTAAQPRWTPAQDETGREGGGSPQARKLVTASRVFGQRRPTRDEGAPAAASRQPRWTPGQDQPNRERARGRTDGGSQAGCDKGPSAADRGRGAPTLSSSGTGSRVSLLSR